MSYVRFAIRGASIEESLGVQLTRELVVAADRCWLCSAPFSKTKQSRDHIFNRWLLKWRDLYNEKFSLLNGSHLYFRQALVGTCTDCNSVHLSRIERRVAAAAKAGLSEFAALPREDVLLWLAKIHFGLLRLELRLPRDRKGPREDTILSESFFEGPLRFEHLLLQAARGLVRTDPSAGSVLLFEVEPGTGKDFEFSDMIDPMFVALRMGSIGIVASLQDWGWLEETWTDLAAPPEPVVDPIGSRVTTDEFFDLTTTAMALARSLRGAPHVYIDDGDDGVVKVQPLGEMNPFVSIAAQLDAEGQPLPVGFRPWLGQVLDPEGLANLGEVRKIRRQGRDREFRRRSLTGTRLMGCDTTDASLSGSDGLTAGPALGASRFRRPAARSTTADGPCRASRAPALKANYYDIETGEESSISGPRKDGGDRLYREPVAVDIDDDVREKYWTKISGRPSRGSETVANG